MYISITDIKRDTILYIIDNMIAYIIVFVCLFKCLELDVEIYINVAVIIILIPLVVSCFLYIRKYVVYYVRESYLREKGIRIQASINKKDFTGSYNRIRYRYKFVAYYTEDNRTYIFHEEMISGNPMMDLELEKIKKEGKFPDKIAVLVDPNNYNRYIMLKYNFINEMYELNQDIVDAYIK